MYNKFLKRLFDLILSVLFLPIFGILYLIIKVMIKKEDNGKVLYISDRIGKNGELFKIYKFRSMKENAKDLRNIDGSTYNSSEDERVTNVGKIIRKTSIDEVPQVLNVLKGDMSFIGPRPDTPQALSMYTIDEKKKLKVRPGITGFNQAFFRNSLNQSEKFKNDVFYVEKQSLIFDVIILFKTVQSVLKRRNINNKE